MARPQWRDTAGGTENLYLLAIELMTEDSGFSGYQKQKYEIYVTLLFMSCNLDKRQQYDLILKQRGKTPGYFIIPGIYCSISINIIHLSYNVNS